MTVFGCRMFDVTVDDTTYCIVSACLNNTTDSCFMSATVESTIWENIALGAGLSKSRASCFATSKALSDNDVKVMVK